MSKKITSPKKELQIPRVIIVTAKIFAFISTPLITRFVAKLFATPIKHKTPKREHEMETKSSQQIINVATIDKQIMSYCYGNATKKVLLVHGWSGRGTQLYKIADELLKNGYSTVSFDAPAHGKSTGKMTLITEFVASIFELEKHFGPFEAVIGHSLGGMAALNATKRGLNVKSVVIIGSGDVIQDIIDDFVSKLQLHPKIGMQLSKYFEKKQGVAINDYSVYIAAKNTNAPLLVIHDNNDTEVPVNAGINIHKHAKNGTLLLTNNLGHRKILGDPEVIKAVVDFVTSKNDLIENG